MSERYNIDVTVEVPEDLSKNAVLRAVRRSLHCEDTDVYPVLVQRAIHIQRHR
jgi:hypothetical protein